MRLKGKLCVVTAAGQGIGAATARAFAREGATVWATSSKQPDPLIYNITAALWNANTRKLLDSGHAKGRAIRLESALHGLGIPLHAGAEKFYREKDLIK